MSTNFTIQSAINASKKSIKDEMRSVFTFINVFNSLKKEEANKYILGVLGVKKLTINELFAYNTTGTYHFQKLVDASRLDGQGWSASELGCFVRLGKKTYKRVDVATTASGYVSYNEYFNSLMAACMIAEDRKRTQEEITKAFKQAQSWRKMSKFDRILAELKEKYADMEPTMLEAIAAKAAAAAIADSKCA